MERMAMVHFAGKLLRGSGKSQILEPIPLLMLRSRQRVSFSTQGPLDLFSVERRPDGLVHVGQGARVLPRHLQSMPFEILGRQHALDEVLHVLLIIAQYFFVVLTQMKASAFQFVFGDTRFGEAGPFFLHQCKRRIGGFPRAGRSHVHHAPSRLRMPSNMGLHGVRKTFLFSNTVHQASGGGTAKRNHSQRERGAQRVVFVQRQRK